MNKENTCIYCYFNKKTHLRVIRLLYFSFGITLGILFTLYWAV
jgi:hypothetical protein